MVVVIDNGFFVALAEKLTGYFKKVYYWTPNSAAFPKEAEEEIGTGIARVERIRGNIEGYFDRVDGFIFPDSNFTEMAQYLKDHGKLVWGAANAEWLEQDRWKYREYMEDNNMDHPETRRIIGDKKLFEFLIPEKDKYVKISRTRGDFETFHWIDDKHSRYKLEQTLFPLGPLKADTEFIVDDAINDAVEIGYDGTVVNGEYPPIVSWGIEIKDNCYLGKVERYSNLPISLRETNAALQPVFKKEKTTSFFSTEVRVNKDGNFLIDPTCRAGSPPFLAELELYSNWPEHIWAGMNGQVVPLRPVARYMGFIFIYSDESDDDWQKVDFPDADKQWYKFYNLIKIDKEHWVVPFRYELGVIGAVVAIGNSPDDVVAKLRKYAEKLKGDVEFKWEAVDKAMKAIKELKVKYGINF